MPACTTQVKNQQCLKPLTETNSKLINKNDCIFSKQVPIITYFVQAKRGTLFCTKQ